MCEEGGRGGPDFPGVGLEGWGSVGVGWEWEGERNEREKRERKGKERGIEKREERGI